MTTDELVSFHKKIFDKMLCKLDSTENPHSFKKYPALPLNIKVRLFSLFLRSDFSWKNEIKN